MTYTVLIVSPHFPPVSAADMHRVRLSLPYFSTCNWTPVVISVLPEALEEEQEPLFEKLIPEDILVNRVKSFPINISRRLGIGNIGIRAYPWVMYKGAKMIRQCDVDLVYFSTSMFTLMTLGVWWKFWYRVPFVIDMQDPWVSRYPTRRNRIKDKIMRTFHRVGEYVTMKSVDGLIAVSQSYIEDLCRRYPQLNKKPTCVLPFGGDGKDFEVLKNHPQAQTVFNPGDGMFHCVYVGVLGQAMVHALSILFGGFRMGLDRNPGLFKKVRIHFVGTDYAVGACAKETAIPLAEKYELSSFVDEDTKRLPYFTALQVLMDADSLVIPGTNDPQYTASKIFPYILSERPFFGLFHEQSSVVEIVEKNTSWGRILTFDCDTAISEYYEKSYEHWINLFKIRHGEIKNIDLWSARNMTRKQCLLFDDVVAGHSN